MSKRPVRQQRTDFSIHTDMTTRIRDMDIYGHMNNVVYGEYFDTAVNEHLIRHGVLDMHRSPVIGLVVNSTTDFFSSLECPSIITIGLRTGSIGRSSVRFEFAAFRHDETAAAAQGSFTHVYVDRASQRPVSLPAPLRALLETMVHTSA